MASTSAAPSAAWSSSSTRMWLVTLCSALGTALLGYQVYQFTSQRRKQTSLPEEAGVDSSTTSTGLRGQQGQAIPVGWLSEEDGGADDEVEIPEMYKDPISLGVISDPVVLCATGHVYDYQTIRAWFSTGNRLCPKSNIEVVDAQITRVPWLKHEVHQWMKEHEVEVPPPEDVLPQLKELHPQLPDWIQTLRSHTDVQRAQALVDLFGVMKDLQARQDSQSLLQLLKDEVLDDMVWLLRYANQYQQGIAASILAYCENSTDCAWLAACASAPAVALCLSSDKYTSQAGTRLLYNLAITGPVARSSLCRLGAVPALTSVVCMPRSEYPYSRDRALATLACLVEEPGVRDYLVQHSVDALVEMVAQTADRWERRDAASLLLKLGLSEESYGDFTVRQLCELWWCSRAWLTGAVDHPSEGFTASEAHSAAVVARLAQHESDLLALIAAHKLGEIVLDPEQEDVAEPAGAPNAAQPAAQPAVGGHAMFEPDGHPDALDRALDQQPAELPAADGTGEEGEQGLGAVLNGGHTYAVQRGEAHVDDAAAQGLQGGPSLGADAQDDQNPALEATSEQEVMGGGEKATALPAADQGQGGGGGGLGRACT